jgi:hypothetical protein
VGLRSGYWCWIAMFCCLAFGLARLRGPRVLAFGEVSCGAKGRRVLIAGSGGCSAPWRGDEPLLEDDRDPAAAARGVGWVSDGPPGGTAPPCRPNEAAAAATCAGSARWRELVVAYRADVALSNLAPFCSPGVGATR